MMVADIDRDGYLDIFSASGRNRNQGVIFWIRNPGPSQATSSRWNRHKDTAIANVPLAPNATWTADALRRV